MGDKPSRAITVAVVDASVVERSAIREILAADPEIVVVGTEGDVRGAADLAFRLRPQVVALGLDRESADSYQAVRQIMGHCPTPILLLAEPGQIGGESVARILAAGALDVMEKPRASGRGYPARLKIELPATVKLLARVPVITHVEGKLRPLSRDLPTRRTANVPRAAVAVVASTGGPMALTRLLSALPSEVPAPLLVVQHIAEGFIGGLADWFQEHCRLPVQVASAGDVAKPGFVLLAPDGKHLTVGREGVVELKSSPASFTLRPSGDRLFQSVASIYGARSIGVVLTGMGSDGALGAASIRAAGGRVIVQDEATSTIFGMPKATIDGGAADEVLPIDAIGDRLVHWIGNQ